MCRQFLSLGDNMDSVPFKIIIRNNHFNQASDDTGNPLIVL